MNKPHILIVEDDRAVRNLLSTTVEMQGYDYRTAATGAAALIEAVSYNPSIIILDLGLPDIDGIDIIKKVRTWSNAPIIVVSARGEDDDKIGALNAGADDYLTKPFSAPELLARLRATMRRIIPESGDGAIFTNGGLKIDYAAGCVFVDDGEIHLTPMEYRLLCLLAKNVGKVLTHSYILKEIWVNAVADDTPSLRVFMATLRRKIEGKGEIKYIQTHINVGYRMLKL